MNRRAAFHAQVTTAASRRGVTLVTGLPRVGRTTLLDEWLRGHPEARKCHKVSEIGGGGRIFVLDHVDEHTVDELAELARKLEAETNPAHLFVLPIDLKTSARIQQKLTGMIETIHLAPIQPLDAMEMTSPSSQEESPDLGALITSIPTNAAPIEPDRHWLRGGLPESLYADSDSSSLGWRLKRLIKGLVELDYSEWGVPRYYRFSDVLLYLANQNSGEFDDNVIPFGSRAEFKAAVHVLERVGLVRRLFNFPAESNVSLGKKQKIYVRDTGILHAMLGIETVARLRKHEHVGASFESYAIEALIQAGGERCRAQFYRAKGDRGEDEIDLVLSFFGHPHAAAAIEIKVGTDERPKRGFYTGCEVINPLDRFVVHSGQASRVDRDGLERLDLISAIKRVTEIAEQHQRRV